MSNVQLSPAALERIAATRLVRACSLHARTSACRSLFGPVDHDELNRDMKSKLQEISERDQQRWNFNFEANSPRVGNYEWVESPADTTPAFYRDSVQTGKTRVAAARVSSPSAVSDFQEIPALDVTPSCEARLAAASGISTTITTTTTTTCAAEVNQENRRGNTLNSGIQTRSKQLSSSSVRRKRTATPDNTNSHITDFFVKRRRPTEPRPAESACLSPKSHIPMEQTPRKRIR